MKYLFILFFISGCFATNSSQEGFLSDSGLEASDSAQEVLDAPESLYNSCVTTVLEDSEYQCLKYKKCIDSNGIGFFNDMSDVCHNFICQMNVSCNGKTYCLPERVETESTFSDDKCSIPIVLAKSGEKFISLKTTRLDNSICVDVFEISNPWTDVGVLYYFAEINSKNYCIPTYIKQENYKFYYIFPEKINTNNFVEK